MKICSVDGCETRHSCKGFCGRHYAKWRKYGDPASGKVNYSSPDESLAKRSKQLGSGCIEWTGGRNANGYGLIAIDGKSRLAHRYAWEDVNGPIPGGMVIDHICSNTSCVNVGHLRVVTHKQNMEHITAKSNAESGYRNVYRFHRDGTWTVVVKHNGVRHYGGRFASPEVANEAAIGLRNKLFTHNDQDR